MADALGPQRSSFLPPPRLYAVVGVCASIVYLGALWNRWALDDMLIIYTNPLVHSLAGVWRAFGESYWPLSLGGAFYRPLTLATYALDWRVGSPAWFHAVNLVWHAAASVAVAALARRWSGDRAALAAGLLFAVHPVHVEAVANIVGRAELMAALFALLAVYAALQRDHMGWSAVALACSLLSKENAAVVPGLVVLGWLLGVSRPAPRRIAVYVASWVVLGAIYGAVRWAVLRSAAPLPMVASVFAGATPLQIRLTAVAAFADIARLLVFPWTLRVDYSPAERTLVTSPLDGRVALGLLCFTAWAALLVLAWRRGRRIEALGLAWIAVALLPVANLLFPIGVLVAERTLYLPSAGLAIALGAWLERLPPARFAPVLGVLVLAGAARAAWRVPVWRDDGSVILSELEDSPNSFDGPGRMAGIYLATGRPAKALEAFAIAAGVFDRSPWLYVKAADAAFTLGRPALADSLLVRLEQLCSGCSHYYRFEGHAALLRGDTAAADSLLARARLLDRARRPDPGQAR